MPDGYPQWPDAKNEPQGFGEIDGADRDNAEFGGYVPWEDKDGIRGFHYKPYGCRKRCWCCCVCRRCWWC